MSLWLVDWVTHLPVIMHPDDAPPQKVDITPPNRSSGSTRLTHPAPKSAPLRSRVLFAWQCNGLTSAATRGDGQHIRIRCQFLNLDTLSLWQKSGQLRSDLFIRLADDQPFSRAGDSTPAGTEEPLNKRILDLRERGGRGS